MKDPSTQNRLAYGFTWKKPKKHGTWYYSYTIFDASGKSVGMDNICTSNTYALIKPYTHVKLGGVL